jgi:hypothetical protein
MLKRFLPMCLFAIALQAQVPMEPSTFTGFPSDTLIQQWITSDDPRLTAWAAHFIIQDSRTSLLPQIESTIENWDQQRQIKPITWSAGRQRAMVAMLDTEIQLHGTVAAEILDHLDGSLDVPRLILLARLPQKDVVQSWKRLYQPNRQQAAVDTRVAAQMLAQNPPSGFTHQLLSTISVSARITVSDPNSAGGFGAGGFSCCGAGMSPNRSDWPEVGSYLLSDPIKPGSPPTPGQTILIPDPDPIYITRQVNRDYYARQSACGGGLALLNDSIRSHLVGTLLGGSPIAPFPEHTLEVPIVFQDREAYRFEVQAFVDSQKENFNQVATKLTARGLMTEQERQSSTLNLTLMLQDLRKQPAPDLPLIAFPAAVHWASEVTAGP